MKLLSGVIKKRRAEQAAGSTEKTDLLQVSDVVGGSWRWSMTHLYEFESAKSLT